MCLWRWLSVSVCVWGIQQEAWSSSFCLDENRIKGQGLSSMKIYCAFCIYAFKRRYWIAVHCFLYGGFQFNIVITSYAFFLRPYGDPRFSWQKFNSLQKQSSLISPPQLCLGVCLSSSYPVALKCSPCHALVWPLCGPVCCQDQQLKTRKSNLSVAPVHVCPSECIHYMSKD